MISERDLKKHLSTNTGARIDAKKWFASALCATALWGGPTAAETGILSAEAVALLNQLRDHCETELGPPILKRTRITSIFIDQTRNGGCGGNCARIFQHDLAQMMQTIGKYPSKLNMIRAAGLNEYRLEDAGHAECDLFEYKAQRNSGYKKQFPEGKCIAVSAVPEITAEIEYTKTLDSWRPAKTASELTDNDPHIWKSTEIIKWRETGDIIARAVSMIISLPELQSELRYGSTPDEPFFENSVTYQCRNGFDRNLLQLVSK